MSDSLRLPGTLSLTLLEIYAGISSSTEEHQNQETLTEDESTL